ncbi:hypothetical protein QYM36_016737 [Artemia franciscana]|uniref:CCHC-type domain-containing protein n=1 Tax=Artemia franciscana TaxID=6661 RepID=A0AA88H462_ARTSF|nr:hypothetical protein QYM36_016737 [Artemia franciscana]
MSSKVLEHWVGCQKPIGAEAVVVEIDKSLVQQIYNQGRILSQRNQADGETIESYVTQLKVLAKDCEFDTLEDQLVRDRLVFGVKNARIREWLLSEGATLTLARAIECSRAIETVQETQALKLNEQAQIPIKQEVEVVQRQKNSPACYFCGGPYSRSHKCPAKGKQCSKCRKMNHFAKMCKSKVVHELETRSKVEDGREFMIESISTEEKVEKPYALIKLTENDSELAFKIDTGAEANILPLKDFNKLARKAAPLPTADVLTSYTGEQLKVLGTANLKVQYKNQTPQTHTFHVVCSDRAPILSPQSSERLQLIKFVLSVSNPAPIRPIIQKLLNEFSDVFEGIGTLPGTCKVYLKEGAIPTKQPPKRVPFALQAKFKEELDRLELLGVIEKVTKPTQWVNSLVLVRKADGSLRICLDPVDLNRAIERLHYPIPLFDEVAAKCKGAKKFFKMDARNGYWSMVLDKPSSELTTFNTMYGSDAEHDTKLRAVFQAARDKGVQFNKEKCVFDTTSITYFGHRLTTSSIAPDPEKTQALENMPAPQNQEELQTLLGMYNYLSRYIPNLAMLNKSLRDLSKQQKFEWNTSHKEAKRGIQNAISKNLSYFDPEAKEIEVITDASQHSLGAQLSTDGATVAFASRSLSEAEQRYSQMEKEMLAITFACKTFHQYLFGRTICVTTDHKPLESIFGKSIQRAPPRLQRMIQQREMAQEAQSKHYNQHARNMEPLKMGQKVWVQLTNRGKWKKATVCKTGNSPCSYYVGLEEGGMFRCNRIHIKSRQDPMVTDLHNGASCQVETKSKLQASRHQRMFPIP